MEDLNRYFSKEDIQVANKHMKRYSTLLIISEISFPGSSVVKPMQEIHVQSLGCEDPLEKGMAVHPVFLPGKSDGQRRLVGYSLWGCRESDTT